MANINRVILVGNLTRDPELRHTPSGTSVCKLRLAVNSRQKDAATGEWGEKPNYFDVTVWGNQGENCAKFLSKGRPVGVDGRLDWREWEAQDGTKRQAVEVIADTVQFLGSRDSGGEGERQFVPAGRGRRLRTHRHRRRHPLLARYEWRSNRNNEGGSGRRSALSSEAQLLLLQGQDRRGRLQERQPAPALRLREGEDPLPPTRPGAARPDARQYHSNSPCSTRSILSCSARAVGPR